MSRRRKVLPSLTIAFMTVALLPGVSLAADSRAELMKAHRGGTVRLVSKSAGGTIDPHINYAPQYWNYFPGIYDGLVAFRKAGGTDSLVVVPDLAEAMPAVENDGKTYVFKLRKGIKFSNGKDLTTDDVVASFQRIFKVSGPTSGTWFNGIIGADACLEKPGDCKLDGGVVADKSNATITINLTAPDAEFLDKLSMPHASILPKETPLQDVGIQPIPGTGPYAIQSYDPNKALVWARNPHFKEWSADAQPDGYVDQFELDFGLTEDAQVNAVLNGQADSMFDQPPTTRLAELGTKYPNQVHLDPQLAFWYLPLNVNLPPFDNLKARQALSYAVDLKAMVNFFGGRNLATPTCQVLPPGLQGYNSFCLYTKSPGATWSAPDIEKAKQLVGESGTAGQPVTIVIDDGEISRNIGSYLQSVLNKIGYNASVKSISANIHFGYIQNSNNKVQLSVTQWYGDYPAASDFLNVLLGCGSFRKGSDSSPNISGFCDQTLQSQMEKAMTLGITDPAAAAKLWATIDQDAMKQAPMIPLFNPKQVTLVSKRIGNFKYSTASNAWAYTLAWVH
ncbi:MULTISPECIES: ABC transporter substrate-binding protein [unclassified Rhizobium]|uniref:ABC transporter substrate-binding protein n=1 Tax=unclassified Rhizobium TaxID=2613769 RepID=UPI0037F8A4CC